jgi:hypothetical protein
MLSGEEMAVCFSREVRITASVPAGVRGARFSLCETANFHMPVPAGTVWVANRSLRISASHMAFEAGLVLTGPTQQQRELVSKCTFTSNEGADGLCVVLDDGTPLTHVRSIAVARAQAVVHRTSAAAAAAAAAQPDFCIMTFA